MRRIIQVLLFAGVVYCMYNIENQFMKIGIFLAATIGMLSGAEE